MKYSACFSTLAFGSFLFALSFAKDLIAGLNSINKDIQAEEPETEILKQFIDMITLHAEVKQLSAHRVKYSKWTYLHLYFERSILDGSTPFQMCLKQQTQPKFSAVSLLFVRPCRCFNWK